jgi:glycosyltransferase involved in cell wall biosynthesis
MNHRKVAIISTFFPSQGGVATYTKYLYENLTNKNIDILILADTLEKEDVHILTPNNINIIRCWDKSPKLISQLTKQIIKNRIDIIHIQYEINLFGNKLNSMSIMVLLFILKLFNKKIIITLHAVIPLNRIDNQFLKENNFSGNLFL